MCRSFTDRQLTGAHGSDYDCGMVRKIIWWMLLVLTPAWVVAADAGAMLHGKGVVLRNWSGDPKFFGDVFRRPDRNQG